MPGAASAPISLAALAGLDEIEAPDLVHAVAMFDETNPLPPKVT